MHPTVERALEVIRKKSEDTGADIVDTLEEWVREVGPGMLEQTLYALGSDLDLGDGTLDMSLFVPEEGQPVGLTNAVHVFERQLLYNVLYKLLTEPNSRAQYTGRVQQEVAMNSPDFGPRR